MDVKAVQPREGFSIAKTQTEKPVHPNTVQLEQTKPIATDTEKKENDKEPSKQQLSEISQQLNKFMEEMSASIQFTVHEKTNSLMVEVVDTKSQKVLKEFPPKEFLDMIANIREYVGFLLDKKA